MLASDSRHDLLAECLVLAQAAKAAAGGLVEVTGGAKDAWLRHSARLLRERTERILQANASDIEAAPGYGLTDAQVDRLRLTPPRIESIAVALEEIAMLRDPLGVVFFIYESRPNVTADAAAICVKSGNAVTLRGGKEAAHSSLAIVEILNQAAVQHKLPDGAIQLVGTTDRPGSGRPFPVDGRLHRRGDPARRRRTGPPRRGRSENAGHQALRDRNPWRRADLPVGRGFKTRHGRRLLCGVARPGDLGAGGSVVG